MNAYQEDDDGWPIFDDEPDNVVPLRERAQSTEQDTQGPSTGAEPAAAVEPLTGIDLGQLDVLPAPLRWIIEGRLVERTLTLIGAKPGVGKSWVTVDLAVAVALGRPWLEHDVPRPRRVLYLDAENGEELAVARLRQLGARSESLAGRLLYQADPLLLTRSADLARVRATLAAHRPELVVVDTLASHAPGAESDTESMATFLSDVWHMCREAGAAMVLLHHLRKSLQSAPKDDPLDAFRGAGHLVGAAHRAWILDPLSPGQPLFLLRDVKARAFASLPPVRVRVLDDEDSPVADRVTRITVEGVEAVVENGYDDYLSRALTFIDGHGGRPVATKDLVHIADDDLSERTVKGYLARAHAAGVLHKPTRGQWVRSEATLTADAETDVDGA